VHFRTKHRSRAHAVGVFGNSNAIARQQIFAYGMSMMVDIDRYWPEASGTSENIWPLVG